MAILWGQQSTDQELFEIEKTNLDPYPACLI